MEEKQVALILFAGFLVVGCVIGGLVVQLTTKFIAGFKPSYRRSLAVAAFLVVASIVVDLLLAAVLPLLGWEPDWIVKLGLQISTLVGICPPVLRKLLIHPEEGPIGRDEASYVILIWGVSMTVIAVVSGFALGVSTMVLS